MSESITLHPTLGVNPHLTVCPRCGGDAEELILLGIRTRIDVCTNCDITVYGGIGALSPCPKCGNRKGRTVGRIGEHDKLQATQPCNKCKKEIEEHKAIVAKGGVYFKCKQCNCTGVVKGTAQLAKIVREKSGIKAPDPVGIEFDTCEQHTPKE